MRERVTLFDTVRRLPRALAHVALAATVCVSLSGCAFDGADGTDLDAESVGEDELAASASRGVRVTRNVSYGPTKANVLDVFTPVAGPTKNRPLVVWIHGGAFASGTRRDPHLVRLAQHSASLGFVSVSIDYELANENLDEDHPFPFPAAAVTTAASDARLAIRFLQAHATEYGIDPNRIAIGGASAGAITALHTAYGPTPQNRNESIRAVVDLWGALQRKEQLQRGDAPILIMHGTKDDHWMPYRNALRLRDSAKANGVPFVFKPLAGKSHGPWEDLDDYLRIIGPFLKRHLE